MRRRVLASLGGGWKNPYVTDGLVAMWDGEWNAGGGIHDPNATVWKDLVGDCDLTLTTHGKFEDKYLQSDGSGFAAHGDVFRDYLTAKVVSSVEEANRQMVVFSSGIVFGSGLKRSFTFTTPGENAISFDTGDNWNDRILRISSRTIVYNEFRADRPSVVYSGIRERTNHISGSWSVRNKTRSSIFGFYTPDSTLSDYPTRGRLYSLLLYSKILSKDEIDLNYAIDKARFNLPDAT